MLNPFDPQLAQLVPLAVQQHLAGQQILLHLQATHQQMDQICPCNRCLTRISPCPHLPGIPKISQDNQSPINLVVVPLAEVKQYEHQNCSHREMVFSAGSVPVVKIQSKYHNVNKCRILLTMTKDLFACFPKINSIFWHTARIQFSVKANKPLLIFLLQTFSICVFNLFAHLIQVLMSIS